MRDRHTIKMNAAMVEFISCLGQGIRTTMTNNYMADVIGGEEEDWVVGEVFAYIRGHLLILDDALSGKVVVRRQQACRPTQGGGEPP
jgi:hypothetical protein